MQKVIGIDPDSKKYGIAIWVDGKLTELLNLDTVEFSLFVSSLRITNQDILFVIENVKKNTFRYSRTDKRFISMPIEKKLAVAFKMGQGPGKCMHSQTVAEQFIEYNGFKIVHVEPQKGNWGHNKNKHLFPMVTGWKGRSNEDTRSAAFIAFLHVKQTRVYHEKH